MCIGMHTSWIPTFGSGEITVRAEKSTRLPDRLPRKRPVLPLSLWHSERIGLRSYVDGSPGTCELKYMATWICRKSQSSTSVLTGAPPLRACRRMLLTWMISDSLIVRSSSLEPTDASISTDGRMHTGGTSSDETSRCSGRASEACMLSICTSLVGIFCSSFCTRNGLSSSAALFTSVSSSGLCALARLNDAWNSCASALKGSR
mmetsp:Transcript_2846/g.7458  ORF Transcript_2846/g.7458 Transcript_2846/m.7458 type:complete len:204 (+) Transcript_2846:235-846(+)